MNYRNLGRSGLRVSEIALGTMQFGWTVGESDSFPILDRFVELGGTLIDTADIYSAWVPNNPGGVSEQIIGRWLKQSGNRDRVLIATKVRGGMGQNSSEGYAHALQREGLSRRWIQRACEDSLRRLGVDQIDLYQVHWVDRRVPIEETLSALTDLVRKGYVRYIGCSNFSAWRLMQSLWAADRHGFESFVSIQPEYSPVQPTRANFERETAMVCAHYGIGVLPYSPLAAGFLTGKYRRGQPLPDSVRASSIEQGRMNEQNWQIIDTITRIAERHGTTPTRVTLAWHLAKPFMTAPIIGANNTRQLEDSMGAVHVKLEPDDVKAIDEVSGWLRSRTENEN